MPALRTVVLSLLMALAACNTAPSSSPPATPTPPSASPSAQPLPSEPVASPLSENCAPVSGGGDTFVLLKDVRVGTHEGYDRITFEFAQPASPPAGPAPAGTLPRYQIKRVSEVFQDGSGEPVAVGGADLHQIVFQGASGVDLSGDTFVLVYTGPKEFKPGFRQLAEAKNNGDFEATLSWALGLNERRCLRVIELADPLRLAVDIPH
ncbi:MAG: AMIN-like domain-containing (lipo)protein [Actinomycetota bacterium]